LKSIIQQLFEKDDDPKLQNSAISSYFIFPNFIWHSFCWDGG